MQTGHWCFLKVERMLEEGREKVEQRKERLCVDWHRGKLSLTSGNEQPYIFILLSPNTGKDTVGLKPL